MSRCQSDAGCSAVAVLDSGYLIVQKYGAQGARFGTIAHQYGMGVKVAIAGPESPADDAARLIKRVTFFDFLVVPPLDLAAQAALEIECLAKDR